MPRRWLAVAGIVVSGCALYMDFPALPASDATPDSPLADGASPDSQDISPPDGPAVDAGYDAPPPIDAAPAWSECVNITATYASCNEYCASIEKACAEACVTSRGYPNWGAEAWSQEQLCGGEGQGQRRCDFGWDDVEGNAPRWKCCCL